MITPLTPPAIGELTLLKLPRVVSRVGLGKSEIYRRIAIGDFPAPVRVGANAVAWSAIEIDAWITARIAARDALKKPPHNQPVEAPSVMLATSDKAVK